MRAAIRAAIRDELLEQLLSDEHLRFTHLSHRAVEATEEEANMLNSSCSPWGCMVSNLNWCKWCISLLCATQTTGKGVHCSMK